MTHKLFLTLFIVFLHWTAFGQNAILKGKVTDAVNDESLPGAQIILNNSSRGTVTDFQGNFNLNLQAGEQSITVRFLGYEEKTVEFSLQPGETQVLDVQLSSDFQQLNSVTITGNLQGQAKALNMQRSADNIVNVVAADQIGRFPDPNAAEALQRVPGVNIERDQGEGRYVFVRGLAPQFTNISVNGEQIPSPEADVRFVALDAIPSDQLSSMEVTKSLTPDMDGDAIGGSVNLVTRMAESAKPEIKGSILGGYNNLMQQPNIQGSLQLGKRFLKNEKLGVLVNGSYYHNSLGSDNWEREPFDNELELRDYELTRTRTGFSSSLDYRFNNNSKIYLRGLYTRFTDREWRRAFVFIPEDGEIEKAAKDRFESQSISTINMGGEHIFPKIRIDYEAQYSYAEQNTPYDNEVVFLSETESEVDFTDGEYPGLIAPGYLDNSTYGFDALESGKTLATDQNITAKVNVGLPYKTGESSGMIKVGGKVRFKEKGFDITQNVYENLGGVPNLDAFDGGLLDDDFLGNRYQLSASADMPQVLRYFNANPSQFELQVEDKAIDEAVESYEATENVYATYVMARHQFKKLMLLAGVRYEKTDVTYKSSDVVINGEGDLEEIIPQDGGTTYDYFLPQVHLKYSFGTYTNLRAAYTFSYARPNFSQIVPAQEANLQDNEATVGNADLLPVSAQNFDLLVDHYFQNVGVLSGGFFYKKLDDFIYNRILYNSVYPLNTSNPIVSGILVTQAQNGESANIYGFEAAYQRQLSFLKGFWKNFNVYLNYTYTRSNANIQNRLADVDGPDATEEMQLPGQTEHMGNAALSYEGSKFSVRTALNFNGAYLSEIGGAAEEDIYIANRAQLDFSGSYTLNSNLRVFAEVLNITNQPFEAYQGSEDVTIQREFYGWWTRVGVKFNL